MSLSQKWADTNAGVWDVSSPPIQRRGYFAKCAKEVWLPRTSLKEAQLRARILAVVYGTAEVCNADGTTKQTVIMKGKP